MKTYKAIMHFNKLGSKSGNPWTVHFKGICYLVSNINCLVPMISEFKPNKKNNPRAYFTAQVSEIKFGPDNTIILK